MQLSGYVSINSKSAHPGGGEFANQYIFWFFHLSIQNLNKFLNKSTILPCFNMIMADDHFHIVYIRYSIIQSFYNSLLYTPA